MAGFIAVAAALAGCAVDATIQADTVEVLVTPTAPVPTEAPATSVPASAPTPAQAPEPVPTLPPPVRTTATPTGVPTEAPTPEPTATPGPIPTVDLPLVEDPIPYGPGEVTIPIAGEITFRLDQPRPILQLPGHTLIYVDPDREAEVDVFTPVADRDGLFLDSYDEVVGVIRTDSAFAGIAEVDRVSIAGYPAIVFEGTSNQVQRGFLTHPDYLLDDAGWAIPPNLTLWLIDTPAGPVAITAESIDRPGQFDQALTIATDLLATAEFDFN